MPGEEALLAGLSGSNMGQLGGQALNMATNVGSMAYNYWLWMKQAQYNRQNMAMQNMWNIQQWERENAYNTPLAQVQRLQAAGINPALAYSNGQMMNEAAQSPTMEMSQLSGAPYVDPTSMAQIDLMQAQAEKLRGENARAEESQPLTLETMRANIETLKGQLEVQKASVKKMNAEEQLVYAQKTLTEIHQIIDQSEAEAQIELWNSQAHLNEAMAIKTIAEYEQLVALFALRQQGLELSNEKLRAELRIDAKQLDVMDQQIDLMQQQSVAAGAAANADAERSLTEQARRNQMEFQNNLTKETEKLVRRQRKWLVPGALLGSGTSAASSALGAAAKLFVK